MQLSRAFAKDANDGRNGQRMVEEDANQEDGALRLADYVGSPWQTLIMDCAICDVQLTARHGSDTRRMCHRTHLTAIRDAILWFSGGDWPHYTPRIEFVLVREPPPKIKTCSRCSELKENIYYLFLIVAETTLKLVRNWLTELNRTLSWKYKLLLKYFCNKLYSIYLLQVHMYKL